MENINITLEELVTKLREKLSQEQYNNMILEISLNKQVEVIKEQQEEIEKQKKIIEKFESMNKPNLKGGE